VSQLREPLLHTGITDALPDDHPLAWTTVYCDWPRCGAMLHAVNNENMQPWIEAGNGSYCVHCFGTMAEETEPETYALRGPSDGA
jgi:hypothetical protein